MMEREIKFRGKTTDGKWVNGYYLPWHAVRDTDGKDVYGQIFEERKEKDKYIPKGWITVIDNTIGQYTGLKGKNGIEIYEGDIIRQDFEDYTGTVGYVYFENGAFKITNLYDGDGYNELSAWAEHTVNGKQRIEVIGNIYDNEELLDR